MKTKFKGKKCRSLRSKTTSYHLPSFDPTTPIKKNLKDPGPLKNQKRFLMATQQFMCSDWIMCLPASKLQYRCVFFRHRLDSGRCSPGTYLGFKIFCWTWSKSLKIAGNLCQLSSWLRAYTVTNLSFPRCVLPSSYLLFWRFHMCSPGIDQRRENTSKLARTLFRVSWIFFQNVGRFSRLDVLYYTILYYTIPPQSPPPPHICIKSAKNR